MTELVLATPEQVSLATIDDQCTGVEAWAGECESIPELQDAGNQLAAISTYLEGKSRDGLARVEAAKRRVEVRIGELLGPATVGSHSSATKEGVSRHERSEFRQMAEHKDVVEDVIAGSTDTAPPSRRKVSEAMRDAARHRSDQREAPIDPEVALIERRREITPQLMRLVNAWGRFTSWDPKDLDKEHVAHLRKMGREVIRFAEGARSSGDLPVPRLTPTISWARGDSAVWQCRSCGVIVAVPGGLEPGAGKPPTPGACPSCLNSWWSEQDVPVGPFAGEPIDVESHELPTEATPLRESATGDVLETTAVVEEWMIQCDGCDRERPEAALAQASTVYPTEERARYLADSHVVSWPEHQPVVSRVYPEPEGGAAGAPAGTVEVEDPPNPIAEFAGAVERAVEPAVPDAPGVIVGEVGDARLPADPPTSGLGEPGEVDSPPTLPAPELEDLEAPFDVYLLARRALEAAQVERLRGPGLVELINVFHEEREALLGWLVEVAEMAYPTTGDAATVLDGLVVRHADAPTVAAKGVVGSDLRSAMAGIGALSGQHVPTDITDHLLLTPRPRTSVRGVVKDVHVDELVALLRERAARAA